MTRIAPFASGLVCAVAIVGLAIVLVMPFGAQSLARPVDPDRVGFAHRNGPVLPQNPR